MPDGKLWPKISIVTPSYNQGQFLEETIRSVLLQNFQNLEYIIMDGGSTDSSVEIIKKYEPWLTYWISEKDNGQADAIKKGFERSTGEILGWINSDDYYLPCAFVNVAEFFTVHSELEMMAGYCLYVKEDGRVIIKNYGMEQDFYSLLYVGMFSAQPTFFFKKDAYDAVGGINNALHFCMDYDLALKLSRNRPSLLLRKVLAACRFHQATKSNNLQRILSSEDKLLGELYGRNTIPSEELDSIKINAWKRYKRLQRRGLLLDSIRDPVHFIKRTLNSLLTTLKIKE